MDLASAVRWSLRTSVAAVVLAAAVTVMPTESGAATIAHVFDRVAAPVVGADGFPPLVGNFAGSAFDDVFGWGPSTFPDRLAVSNGDRTFGLVDQSVSGFYAPLVGDFGGDAHDDILWYAAGTARDSLWISRGDGTWTKTGLDVRGDYTPFVGDFSGTGRDSIFWYAWGPVADAVWSFSVSGAHTSRAVSVNGSYIPTVADVADGSDGHHGDDIIWQAIEPRDRSSLWTATGAGFSSTSIAVPNNATAPILVGSFGGDDHDDLFVYGPAGNADDLLIGSPSGPVAGPDVTVHGVYIPIVGDWDGDGHDDVLWGHAFGGEPDSLWMGTGAGHFRSVGRFVDHPGGYRFASLASSLGQRRRVVDFADTAGSATEDLAITSIPTPETAGFDHLILYGLPAPP